MKMEVRPPDVDESTGDPRRGFFSERKGIDFSTGNQYEAAIYAGLLGCVVHCFVKTYSMTGIMLDRMVERKWHKDEHCFRFRHFRPERKQDIHRQGSLTVERMYGTQRTLSGLRYLLAPLSEGSGVSNEG
ncbi:uncharacterized protein LOC134979913 isoform X1 [Pseudophryne corroboree]|uniref:uncharacterized protein LOC134979913 isoform X1 n=1 Tax=Pseudophryne corroboree TaxID=495146 RepID=UPI0030817A52